MCGDAMRVPLLLGHRGCRLPKFHENTISAFAHAIDSGCDGFEFDIRSTSDEYAVCLHDPSIGDKVIAECTYDDFCKDSFKSGKSEIATLNQVVEKFGNSAFLNIELKVRGLEEQVLEIVKELSQDRFVISSFQSEIICRIRELDPEVPVGFIFGTVDGLRSWPILPGPYVIPNCDLVTPALVDSVHAGNRKLVAWTVNRPAEMKRLADWGVDGLISDNPALLCKTLRRG